MKFDLMTVFERLSFFGNKRLSCYPCACNPCCPGCTPPCFPIESCNPPECPPFSCYPDPDYCTPTDECTPDCSPRCEPNYNNCNPIVDEYRR